jgi:archaellum component FlaF (FlaF/FlaG flagellin family)
VVNFNKKGPRLHPRRGISTIVGAAIFLVLFASATSTFFLAMDAQRDTINSQRAISDAIMEKTKEKFSIAVSTDESNSNRLGIQVKNQGTNPVEIDNIWVVNKSGSYPAKKYLIDYKDSVIPSGYGSNILENTPLFMQTDDYDIKVVL